jgi:hypothetical protein
VDGGRARQPGQATGRQGGRGAATRTGDREAGWQGGRGTAGRAWDSTADKRRQHEGQLAAEAAGVGQGTARRHCAEGGLQWHRADESSDKADERVHGRTWVGRPLELSREANRSGSRRPLNCCVLQ